jgi:hypothetical protein
MNYLDATRSDCATLHTQLKTYLVGLNQSSFRQQDYLPCIVISDTPAQTRDPRTFNMPHDKYIALAPGEWI